MASAPNKIATLWSKISEKTIFKLLNYIAEYLYCKGMCHYSWFILPIVLCWLCMQHQTINSIFLFSPCYCVLLHIFPLSVAQDVFGLYYKTSVF